MCQKACLRGSNRLASHPDLAGSGISAAAEWRRGWGVVVSGAMGMALASTTVYTLGIFIAPLEAEFGWSRAQISAGLTINTVLAVLFSPFIGILVDRIGVRRLGIFGSIGYCAAFAALALTTASVWSWWGLWFLLGLVGLAIKPTTWSASVSSMFSASRGLALSLTLCGTALGSSLTPIVGNYLIEHYGWRHGLVGLGAFWALLVVPPVLVFLTSARDIELKAPAAAPGDPIRAIPVLTGVPVREGLRSWRFFRLAMAGFLTCLVIVSFVASLVPILSSHGFPRQTAANIAGMVGLATILGRITGGYFLDRANGNMVGAISVGLAIIPSVLFLAFPHSHAISAAAVLVLGLTMGAELDAVAYLTTRHFGMRHFGVLFGTIAGLLALATGLGPLFVNLTYDLTHSYELALMAYVPLSVIAAGLFLSLGRYPQFDAPEIVADR